ncbi:MAG: metallophosphoesterase [Oscillospiraceae bacterium]|nr:metallophosphoesterase [Oscillospiraceae bacterium]
MKRILTVCLMVVMLMSLCAACKKETARNQNQPGTGRVLITADVHVSSADAHSQDQLRKTLTYAKDHDVDLVIFNGDLVDVGNAANYATLNKIFRDVFGSPERANVKFIFNMGNHEFYPTDACAHEETDYEEQFDRFAAFATKWSDFTADQGSIYLTEVNGISYVVAAPSDKRVYMSGNQVVYCAGIGGYHTEDIALIDSLIAQATKENPGEPVYLLSHHPWGETYGGASYGMPEIPVVTGMRAVMEKYPHLVNITSHTHFSSLHERSFAQDQWTTINTGMHTTGKYVDIEFDAKGEALDYANIENRRYTSADPVGQALHGKTHLVWDVRYGEESFTATVFNMATETAYSHLSYTVPYGITAENQNEKFLYELSDRTAPTLTWSAEDELTAELIKTGSAISMKLTFSDTEQFYTTEGYRICVMDTTTGETLKTLLWASHFWAAQDQKASYEITVDELPACSEYTVTVEAIDFYGNFSVAKLEATV